MLPSEVVEMDTQHLKSIYIKTCITKAQKGIIDPLQVNDKGANWFNGWHGMAGRRVCFFVVQLYNSMSL